MRSSDAVTSSDAVSVHRELEHGLVVARHKGHVTIEDADGRRVLCRTAHRRMQLLVADDVEWRREPGGTGGTAGAAGTAGTDDTAGTKSTGTSAGTGTGTGATGGAGGTITRLLPRRSTLTRIDSRGRRELVAANLTRLVVVAALSPAPDWLVVDHYLVAAELAGLSAIIVINKIDLGGSVPDHLECYRRAGYPVLAVSTADGRGLAALAADLHGERSALVGQSGVGKSSIMNTLLGDEVQSTGTLTGKGAQGRHTTSGTVLYRLATGGELVDSPGVRAYSPWIEDPRRLEHGFPELRERLGRCRFDNCRHLAEPGCAVKAAVERREICPRRYESYARLHGLLEKLGSNR